MPVIVRSFTRSNGSRKEQNILKMTFTKVISILTSFFFIHLFIAIGSGFEPDSSRL